ncbi:MAG: hypothetical protein J6X16_02360 [Bacteroidales bacterium]|nr:hypothetical protein [Bacteroidales bacterium]
MKNDAAIEDLFVRYQPDLGNSDQYMEQLSKGDSDVGRMLCQPVHYWVGV